MIRRIKLLLVGNDRILRFNKRIRVPKYGDLQDEISREAHKCNTLLFCASLDYLDLLELLEISMDMFDLCALCMI
jgi:hypothetical protein